MSSKEIRGEWRDQRVKNWDLHAVKGDFRVALF